MTQLPDPLRVSRRTTVEDASDSDDDTSKPSQDDEHDHLLRKRRPVGTRLEDFPYDPRFRPPAPAPWKRGALLLFIAVMFWLAFSMRKRAWDRKNKVLFAKRYVYAIRYGVELG